MGGSTGGTGTGSSAEANVPAATTGDAASFSFSLTDNYGNVITTENPEVAVDLEVAYVHPVTGEETMRSLPRVESLIDPSTNEPYTSGYGPTPPSNCKSEFPCGIRDGNYFP